MRLFLLDNYDSFTWNLVQAFESLGADVTVRRNDAVEPGELVAAGYDRVVVSPGPGTPRDAGASVGLIRSLAGTVPLLGVCLGHQAIAEAWGGRIERAPELVHGRTSPIHHDGRGVFRGLPSPFDATRYHSLAVAPGGVPAGFEISARTAGGVVMGLRHARLPVEGIQFHPESILTKHGPRLLANFLAEA